MSGILSSEGEGNERLQTRERRESASKSVWERRKRERRKERESERRERGKEVRRRERGREKKES